MDNIDNTARGVPMDRPATELERLHNELARAHELFSNLEAKLHPVLHGLNTATAATSEKAVVSNGHISQAVQTADALCTRIANVLDNLAV